MTKTARRYDFNELRSVLQNDIRRGKKSKAMFWAVELESFNDKALWNRLRVIASEDISIANPMLPLLIDVLEKQYFEFKQKPKDKNHRLFLAHAILALCESEKSRIAGDLVNFVYGEIKFKRTKLEIPDHALDKHTLKGRKKGRDWDHFFKEGAKLVNEGQKVKNSYKEKVKEILLKHGEP